VVLAVRGGVTEDSQKGRKGTKGSWLRIEYDGTKANFFKEVGGHPGTHLREMK